MQRWMPSGLFVPVSRSYNILFFFVHVFLFHFRERWICTPEMLFILYWNRQWRQTFHTYLSSTVSFHRNEVPRCLVFYEIRTENSTKTVIPDWTTLRCIFWKVDTRLSMRLKWYVCVIASSYPSKWAIAWICYSKKAKYAINQCLYIV